MDTDKITAYRIDEAMLDAAAAMQGRLNREGYEDLDHLPLEALELIRKAAAISIGVKA